MTRTTNARLAGFTFLFYIAVGMASLVLFGRATGGAGTAAQLLGIAQHASAVRLTIVLDLLANLSALVLGVTLFAITREEDPHLAMLAMACRFAEGISGIGTEKTQTLLWLATPGGTGLPDPAGAQALGAYLLRPGGFGPGAFYFAVGSTIFAWLLLRGGMVPAALAWLGVVASAPLVVVLPLELAGFLGHVDLFTAVTRLMWYPMLVFEVALALWLLVRGVAAPRSRARQADGGATCAQ